MTSKTPSILAILTYSSLQLHDLIPLPPTDLVFVKQERDFESLQGPADLTSQYTDSVMGFPKPILFALHFAIPLIHLVILLSGTICFFFSSLIAEKKGKPTIALTVRYRYVRD